MRSLCLRGWGLWVGSGGNCKRVTRRKFLLSSLIELVKFPLFRFAKNQKRASTLISDVFSALSPPPPGPPPHPSPSSVSSASSRSKPQTPSPHASASYFQPLHPTSTMTASITNSSSLLDDDDNDDGRHRGTTRPPYMLISDDVKPSLPPSLKRQPQGPGGMTGAGGGQKPPNPTMKVMQPTLASSLPQLKNREQEEEWNW